MNPQPKNQRMESSRAAFGVFVPEAAPRATGLAAVLLIVLGGCSVTYSTSTQQPPAPVASSSLSAEPVYLTEKPIQIRREYLYRYACPTNQPLICRCPGRIGRYCNCHC